MIRAAIFDVDGTLLDSMHIWLDAGARYLKSINIEAEPGLGEMMSEMSISEAVTFMKDRYNIPYSEEEISSGIIEIVREFYYYEATLKDGVIEFLEYLWNKKVPMVIATSSDRSYLDIAFARIGIAKYFRKIFTCKEVGAGKTQSLIYEKAGEYLETLPEETWVFEDAIHAVKSAKNAGFKVVGVYDEISRKDIDGIKALSDIFVNKLSECTLYLE